MEFVAYGEGEGEGNDSMDTGLGQMSEKVQAIAQSLYIELEGMVRQFGPEPAQTVTPFLVRLLETLDEEIKQRRTCQTELELAKADREQLLNHYERERELRKKAEEYQFIAEDEADLDKSALQEQLEDLEGRLRHLDTKAQNYDDISRRTAETEDQLKHKYAELSKRHAEILQKYIGLSEENKSLRSSQGSTPLHETQRTKVTKGSPESVTETYNINIISGDTISNAELNESSSSSDLSCKKLDHNKSLDEEMKELSTRSSTQSKNHSPFTDTSSDIPEDVEELIAKTAATVSKDTTGCDLSTQATFDSNSITSSKSIADLEEENSRLLETKNALNIVKDDLLKELEEMTNRYATVKVEFEKSMKEKDAVYKRVSIVEADMQKLRLSIDNEEKDEEDEPTEKRKRFTRVEMARVLMERNQYKERLMELQEAVRWTEMLRASKYEQLEERRTESISQSSSSKGKSGGIYKFFSSLFGASTDSSHAKHVSSDSFNLKSPSSSISPSNSAELSELCKVAGFVQNTEKHMSQMSGWILPDTEVDRAYTSNIPIPNHCAPLADSDSANSKIWCATCIDGPEPLICIVSASRAKASRITIFKSSDPQKQINSFTLREVVVLCQLYVAGCPEPANPDPTLKQPITTRPDSIDATQGTLWFGSQHGILYVHRVALKPEDTKVLGQLRLADSVVSLNSCDSSVIAALANGSLAVIRQINGVWNFSDVNIIDFGAPHYAIGCAAFIPETKKLWCGYRNEVKIVSILKNNKNETKTIVAHPRNESRVRLISKFGAGVWVSIRLDSTLRLYNAKTGQHLQDLDCEPFVSKIFGDTLCDRPSFSFVRITALHAGRDRLWIGTGHGIVLAIPYKESLASSYKEKKLAKEESSDFYPECSMSAALLSVHGFREAVKFFVNLGSSDSERIAAGGIGYIDFRTATQSNLSASSDMLSKSYFLCWQN